MDEKLKQELQSLKEIGFKIMILEDDLVFVVTKKPIKSLNVNYK